MSEIALKKVSNVKRKTSNPLKSREAYWLRIAKNGKVHIEFEHSTGGLRALQTLPQLFYRHSKAERALYTSLAPATVFDSPYFEYRGLNLDISRNQIFPEDVKRTLDGMAMNKLNRLHLHAADSQSWPLHIPALPELAVKGAYDEAQLWSVESLQEVQQHGKDRGIDVHLEVDLPGHATVIGNAYPDLVVAANHDDWPRYALEPPAGQLRLNSSGVYKFLDKLLADLAPRVSPYTSLFHLGGDEVNLPSYELDPTVKSSSHAVLKPLMQSLMSHATALVQSHGLTPIVWEEMVLDWNLTLPAGTLIQTWRNSTSLSDVLDRGHRALFGPNPHWYLDCGFGGFFEPDPKNPDTPIKPPYLDYCTTYRNWRHVLSYDPFDGISKKQQHLIVGGEAHMWAELTDTVNLDGKLWPRVAAAAEVLWTGPPRPVNEDATRRLAEMRERLVARGFRPEMVQMEWCLRNKGRCRI